MTSKVQITLPKPVRQALDVTTGSQIAFEFGDGEVIVTRAGIEHEDPAIGAFLRLLEADIRKGKNLGTLSKELAQAMHASKAHTDSLNEDARHIDPRSCERNANVKLFRALSRLMLEIDTTPEPEL